VARQTYLPLGVTMWPQVSLVGSGEHNQTTVVPVNVLHGSPRTNDVIGRPEGEVVQILVQRMPGCLLA
jgi:hypothetical protein